MNTDKLVPIDFSRKITPFIKEDEVYNTKTGITQFIDDLDVHDFNEADPVDSEYFVVSYADRPNTGKHPVADDVMIDIKCGNGTYDTGDASLYYWLVIGPLSWRPNHAAMVERYQAPLADKEDERMNNIARNGNDGDHYDVNPELAASMVAPVGKVEPGLIVSKQELSAIQTLKSFGYKYENGVWSQQEAKPELAAYMVPHVMDSSIKRLGVFLRKNELVNEGEGVIDCVIRELAEKHDIDIRTDEEKLRDAIVDIWEQEPDKDAIIDALLASFTIKGK